MKLRGGILSGQDMFLPLSFSARVEDVAGQEINSRAKDRCGVVS